LLSRLPPVLLAAIGVALLSAMDAVIKHLSVTNGVLAIATGRYLFGMAAAMLIWNGAGRPTITTEMIRAHAFRGALIVVVAGLFFYALGVLPLAEAVTIAFIAPLMIPFFAWGIVGERPRAASLVACAAGFVGALVATSGGPALQTAPRAHTLGVLAVLASTGAYAWTIALLRTRAGRDGPAAVGLLQTALPLLFMIGPALAFSHAPPLADIPFFILMGTLGAAGWYVLIIAYARAEAQRLAPLEFTGLVWASLLGFAFFAETPRPQVLAGAALIIAACLFAAWEERRGKVPTPPASTRPRAARRRR
jgi:S-adenosylmethionine uptake transporter